MKALFVFNGDAAKPPALVCFDDLLKLDHRVLRAEQVKEAGRELVMVEVRFVPSATATFWFDPAVNHLVRRMQATVTDSSAPTVFTSEVQKFRDGGGGVYFPESVVTQLTINGQLLQTDTIRFTEIRVNQLIDPKLLTLDFPSGAEVHDLVQGVVYFVGANGQPVGPGTALPSPPPPAAGERITARTATLEEPGQTSHWPLYVAGGLFVLAAAVWTIRWRRERLHEG